MLGDLIFSTARPLPPISSLCRPHCTARSHQYHLSVGLTVPPAPTNTISLPASLYRPLPPIPSLCRPHCTARSHQYHLSVGLTVSSAPTNTISLPASLLPPASNNAISLSALLNRLLPPIRYLSWPHCTPRSHQYYLSVGLIEPTAPTNVISLISVGLTEPSTPTNPSLCRPQ
ncbi:hypothetical protein PoB_007412300 [Plakobranchus ocellatus]|uniref:Uncharacterized protein n=1 Tax=Plakobranchus ocellatus TaxID=259542 RepID=A0AAV4DU37_9GAST|nr:hypothetical protein PoB_007412300 [Plakobranchus ocellatus]